MLTMQREKYRFCDGLSRRSFLEIGSSAVGGISLPEILRADEQQNSGNSQKSVIMVYLSGGLAHQDTFDLKPDAPEGIRGEFKPMDSSVPGVQVGELLPKMASVMDRVALVRSVVGLRDDEGLLLIGGHILDLVADLAFFHLPIGSFDEAELVDPRVAGKRRN